MSESADIERDETAAAAAGDVGGGRRWHAHVIGLFIAALYIAILLATARDIGFSRDEGFYFSASSSYARWFKALAKNPKDAVKKSTVDRHWRANSEHPALMKSLFALSWLTFHKKLKIMAESTSFRFPGMLMGGLLLYILTVFGTRIGGLRVGVFAALAMALMPRFFYHAHLDCFDVGITTMWFAVAFAFWKSLNSFKWAIVTGLLWGLALETKLNAFFIPVLFLLFYFIHFGKDFFLTAALRGTRGRGLIAFPPLPFALFSMAILGPLVFLGLWPWLWFDTIKRIGNYIGFHMHHAYYNIEYFGTTYFQPPFPISYPFVMTLITIPLITTVLALVGICWRLRFSIGRWLGRWWKLPAGVRERETTLKGINLFLLINLLFPLVLIALPKSPIFGGTKHWMPAWPFIALFAGFGFRAASEGIGKVFDMWKPVSGQGEGGVKIRRAAIAIALGLLFIAPAGQQTEVSHPFGLSHYTLPIGETPGSADAGMCRQFWGFTTGSAAPWLNEHVEPNGRVYFHDTAWDSYNMLIRDATLRQDIRWAGGVEGSDYAMVHWEQHMSGYEYAEWTWFGTSTPAHVVSHQGVTILPIYTTPERLAAIQQKSGAAADQD